MKNAQPSGRVPKISSGPKVAPSVALTVERHGDLLFDLCESVLWSAPNAQLAFRRILKRVLRYGTDPRHEKHERAWVLRLACDVLVPFAERNGRKLAPAEQAMLDHELEPEVRLQQLESYFHRLPISDQILLILHDKHGIPYPDISVGLGIPVETLKLRRLQALRTIEEWIWTR